MRTSTAPVADTICIQPAISMPIVPVVSRGTKSTVTPWKREGQYSRATAAETWKETRIMALTFTLYVYVRHDTCTIRHVYWYVAAIKAGLEQ